MKKKISLLLAFIMSVTMLSACSDVKNTSETLPTVETITQADTATTTETEETTEETTTEATTEETSETTEATTVSESETSAETSETTAENTEKEWTETAADKTMYVTQSCYSRVKAVVGSKSVNQYTKGKKVKVTAITSTGYYKIEDGSFIHSDYLSDEAVSTTTAATTKKPASTTAKPSGNKPSGDSKPTGEIIGGASYKIDYKTRYAYKQLSASNQALYGALVEAIERLETQVEVPSGCSREDIIEVYCLVFNQEPQLFWMSSQVPSGSNYLFLDYKVDDKKEIAKMQKEIDVNVSSILKTANGYSSTVSKLKVFYDWVIKHAEFSKEAGGYNSTVYHGLGGGGALQCAGYAKSIKYLCDLAGIECMVIVGSNADGASHAWNVVYCDNGYYNLDATWGDPVNSFDSSYIQYEFFLVPDSWIHNKTHFNVNVKVDGTQIQFFTPPACTKEACNYFKAYNKTYSSYDAAEKALYAELDSVIASGGNVVSIRVTDKSIYDQMMTDAAAKKYNTYAKGCSGNVKGISKQAKISFGVLVVHYNVVYK